MLDIKEAMLAQDICHCCVRPVFLIVMKLRQWTENPGRTLEQNYLLDEGVLNRLVPLRQSISNIPVTLFCSICVLSTKKKEKESNSDDPKPLWVKRILLQLSKAKLMRQKKADTY